MKRVKNKLEIVIKQRVQRKEPNVNEAWRVVVEMLWKDAKKRYSLRSSAQMVKFDETFSIKENNNSDKHF